MGEKIPGILQSFHHVILHFSILNKITSPEVLDFFISQKNFQPACNIMLHTVENYYELSKINIQLPKCIAVMLLILFCNLKVKNMCYKTYVVSETAEKQLATLQ